MVPVYENYSDYRPPRFVHRTVESLLSSLPKGYLSGLQSVVLTNAKAVERGRTIKVKRKKVVRAECLGFYHPGKRGESPWIEIVVDNIISGVPHVFWHLPVVRKMMLSEPVFHEIGHHLDYTIGAPARSGEAAAEAWQKRLTHSYAKQHYWYLIPVARFVVRCRNRIRTALRNNSVRRQAASSSRRSS